MKKFIAIVLSTLMMLSFASCGNESSTISESEDSNEIEETESSAEVSSSESDDIDAQSTEETECLTEETDVETAEELVLIRRTYYNPDNTVFFLDEYEYDEQGNLVRESNCYPDGQEPFYWMEYEYDDQGRLVSSVDGQGNSYEYDDHGNIISCSGFEAYGTSNLGYSCELEYDDQGDLVIETVTYDNGDDGGRYEYEYDDQGNQTRINYYGANEWYQVFEYDDQGNEILSTRYDADGNTTFWYECEYDTIN